MSRMRKIVAKYQSCKLGLTFYTPIVISIKFPFVISTPNSLLEATKINDMITRHGFRW